MTGSGEPRKCIQRENVFGWSLGPDYACVDDFNHQQESLFCREPSERKLCRHHVAKYADEPRAVAELIEAIERHAECKTDDCNDTDDPQFTCRAARWARPLLVVLETARAKATTAIGERNNAIILLRHRLFAAAKSFTSNHASACSIWGDDGQGHTKENFPQPLPCNCGALENFQRAKATAWNRRADQLEDNVLRERMLVSSREQTLSNYREALRSIESKSETAQVVISAISEEDWAAIVNACGACEESAQVQQDATYRCERHDYLFAARAALGVSTPIPPGGKCPECHATTYGEREVHLRNCSRSDIPNDSSTDRHTGINAHACCEHDPRKACCDNHSTAKLDAIATCPDCTQDAGGVAKICERHDRGTD